MAWLKRFRRGVAREAAVLGGMIESELGKPGFESLVSDIWPLLASCRWHQRYARRWLAPRRLRGGTLLQLGQRHKLYRRPLGHVVIIATWNYPVQLLGIQLLQAVLAGNRVTVKPSEKCPRTQAKLLEIARGAGLAHDRLAWTEATREAGLRLLEDASIDHVVFTGSTAVGRQIAERLASTLTPSTLELSGSDSALVLQDADVELAARSIGFGVLLNGGATCMGPRRVVVSASVYEPFVEALRDVLSGTDGVGRYVHAESDRAHALAASAVIAGGRWLNEDMAVPSTDRLKVVIDCPSDTELACGEHFGPALAVIRAEDDTQVHVLARRYPQRLATSVFTSQSDASLAQTGVFQDADIAGFVTINDCVLPTAHPASSLVGRGPSGWGVSRGGPGLLAMTRPVVVSRTSNWCRLPAGQTDPRAERWVRRWVRWRYG